MYQFDDLFKRRVSLPQYPPVTAIPITVNNMFAWNEPRHAAFIKLMQ